MKSTRMPAAGRGVVVAVVTLWLFALLPGSSDAQSESGVLRDVAYGPHFLQTMDIYLPAELDNPPVIFMMHGGAWMIGDKAAEGVVVNKSKHWLDKGYVFISANTRLLPDANPLEQADDLAAAIAAAQSMAGSWGGDPGRFVLMGHSAGAHLVALLAADPQIAARHDVAPWLGTVALDGPYDIPRILNSEHMAFYDRVFGDDPAFWRENSPVDQLADPPAPMLFVCSSLSPRSCPFAKDFAADVNELGGRATVLPEALSHSAINAELGLPGKYTESVEMFLNSLGLP